MSSTVSRHQSEYGWVQRVGQRIVSDKRVGAGVVLWIFGLLAVFVLPPPVPITESKLNAYTTRMMASSRLEDVLTYKRADMWEADDRLRAEKGWFPWLKSAAVKKKIAALTEVYNRKKAAALAAEKEWALAQRNANKELGLFSSHGVQAARKHFWNSFEKGKVIGRRNTLWDGFFLILNRRYESVMEMVVQLAFYMVVNLSAAMFMMFWFFTFGLPSLIWSLGGSWVGGTLFFLIAVLGAASVMATFIGLLSGTTAAAVYGLSTLTRLQLEGARNRPRPQLRADDPRYRRTPVGSENYYRAHRHAD